MSRTNRLTICALAFTSALLGACAGSDGSSPSGGSPTGPSPTPSPSPSGNCSRPGAPANLNVTAADTRVSLTWSASSGAVDYFVLIGNTPSSSNEISTNTTQTNFQWNGAPVGTHYARIQARNSCGSSGSSNEVAFTVTSAS